MRALALVALLAPALPAAAQDLAASHLYAPGGSGCFLRQYSGAHMDSHPQQRVTQIALGRDGWTPGAPDQVLRLRVIVRGGDWGEALAFCRAGGPGMLCSVEGDGGAFSLEGRADGKLMLRALGEGVVIEGRLDFFTLSPKVGDDGAFLIPPVPADACP